MILPDMTSEQMMKVMDDDRSFLRQLADSYMTNEGRHILRNKHTVFPCSLTKFVTAPESHQRYLLTFRIANKYEAYDGGHRFYFRAIINSGYGTEAANIAENSEDNSRHITYFCAHLFHRYAERMGLKMQGEELIRYFTKRNPMMIEATQWRKEQDCMMLCHDGACFGEYSQEDQSRINLKTFIATDTMQDDTYRAKLNGDYNMAVVGVLWKKYLQDPEMADFLARTTKCRKTSKKK